MGNSLDRVWHVQQAAGQTAEAEVGYTSQFVVMLTVSYADSNLQPQCVGAAARFASRLTSNEVAGTL